MGIPHQQQKLLWLQASEVREYVYCPRAWIYRKRNVKPKLSQEEIDGVEMRFENGRQFHRQHGEAVCLAAQQRRRSVNWCYFGLTAAVLAIVVLSWR